MSADLARLSRHMAGSYTRAHRRRAFGRGQVGRLPLYWLPGRRKQHWCPRRAL